MLDDYVTNEVSKISIRSAPGPVAIPGTLSKVPSAMNLSDFSETEKSPLFRDGLLKDPLKKGTANISPSSSSNDFAANSNYTSTPFPSKYANLYHAKASPAIDLDCCTMHQERSARLQQFREHLLAREIDAAVIQDMQDMYWLTGFNTPGAPRGQSLIVTQTSAVVCSRRLEVTNAACMPGIATAGYHEGWCPIQHVLDVLLAMQPKSVAVQIGNERTTPHDANYLYSGIRAKSIELFDLGTVLRAMRAPKSRNELSLMRRAGEFCASSMHAALGDIARAGSTEASIVAAAEFAARNDGGDYKAYPTFVAIGTNGERGHYCGNDAYTAVREGENIFIELAGCHQRYHVAMMRTAYVGERLPSEMKLAEEHVVRALAAMRSMLQPGVMPTQVYMAGEKELEPLLKSGWIINQRSGYSIGIGFATDWGEAEEISTKKLIDGTEKPIPENATMHLIPWVRHPVYGAVGISDTVVVRPGGSVSLLPKNKPKEAITLIAPQRPHREDALRTRSFFGPAVASPSPLVRVQAGLELPYEVLVKDESSRLGQKAFKALGGGFALACALMRAQGKEVAAAVQAGATFDSLARKECEAELTFCTASDGNHGAGVAWAAFHLKHKAVIYFPRGTAQARVDTARSFGAEVRVSEFPYDQTVAVARKEAAAKGWTLVQDTAWEGYETVPADIMAAYKLIALEAVESMENANVVPTHVILQVGVGSFAAAMIQFLREHPLTRDARILCVEPKGSACLMASMQNGVKTDLAEAPSTISVGLDCLTLSDLAWPTMRTEVDATVAIADSVAADGVRSLRRVGLCSGESGAATGVGFLRSLSLDPRRAQALGLTSSSKVLVFNTEGTTAPEITAEVLVAPDHGPAPPSDVKVYCCPHENARILLHARDVFANSQQMTKQDEVFTMS